MKIIVVDDHPLARKGIISILQGYMNDCCISEETCVEGALNALNSEMISLMFVDLKLGNENGLDVIRNGREISPDTKYVIITTYMTRKDFQIAEELNVSAYISKCAAPEDIIFIIDLISRGKKYYDSDLVSYDKQETVDTKMDLLTLREKEVLLELGKGLSNEEIGKQLFISVNTVKKHISSIMAKLNLEHRTQLILYINNFYSSSFKDEQSQNYCG